MNCDDSNAPPIYADSCSESDDESDDRASRVAALRAGIRQRERHLAFGNDALVASAPSSPLSPPVNVFGGDVAEAFVPRIEVRTTPAELRLVDALAFDWVTCSSCTSDDSETSSSSAASDDGYTPVILCNVDEFPCSFSAGRCSVPLIYDSHRSPLSAVGGERAVTGLVDYGQLPPTSVIVGVVHASNSHLVQRLRNESMLFFTNPLEARMRFVLLDDDGGGVGGSGGGGSTDAALAMLLAAIARCVARARGCDGLRHARFLCATSSEHVCACVRTMNAGTDASASCVKSAVDFESMFCELVHWALPEEDNDTEEGEYECDDNDDNETRR